MAFPDGWKFEKATIEYEGVTVEYVEDPTGVDGNTCVIIRQDGDTIHLMPERLTWLIGRLQEAQRAVNERREKERGDRWG